MFRTEVDTSATAYGMTVTLFGQPANRNVRIGRDTCSGTCSMPGCRERCKVFLVRTVEVDVNADARNRWWDGYRQGPCPAVVLGFKFVKLWACAFHFPEILDHAYTMPGHGETPCRPRRRARREHTVYRREHVLSRA